MNLAPDAYPAYPQGKEDNTHLQPNGAMLIASLVSKGLNRLGSPYSTLLLTEEETDYHDKPLP